MRRAASSNSALKASASATAHRLSTFDMPWAARSDRHALSVTWMIEIQNDIEFRIKILFLINHLSRQTSREEALSNVVLINVIISVVLVIL